MAYYSAEEEEAALRRAQADASHILSLVTLLQGSRPNREKAWKRLGNVLSLVPGVAPEDAAHKDREAMLAMERELWSDMGKWWNGARPDAPPPEGAVSDGR